MIGNETDKSKEKTRAHSWATTFLLIALTLFVFGYKIRGSSPINPDDYRTIDFGQLSNFPFPITYEGKVGVLPDGSLPRIPDAVLELDNQKVRLSGFLMPLQFDGDNLFVFMLVKDQQDCCFGQVPEVNHWVLVEMKKPVDVTGDAMVTLYGTLQVGKTQNDEGQVLFLYRMLGDELEVGT